MPRQTKVGKSVNKWLENLQDPGQQAALQAAQQHAQPRTRQYPQQTVADFSRREAPHPTAQFSHQDPEDALSADASGQFTATHTGGTHPVEEMQIESSMAMSPYSVPLSAQFGQTSSGYDFQTPAWPNQNPLLSHVPQGSLDSGMATSAGFGGFVSAPSPYYAQPFCPPSDLNNLGFVQTNTSWQQSHCEDGGADAGETEAVFDDENEDGTALVPPGFNWLQHESHEMQRNDTEETSATVEVGEDGQIITHDGLPDVSPFASMDIGFTTATDGQMVQVGLDGQCIDTQGNPFSGPQQSMALWSWGNQYGVGSSPDTLPGPSIASNNRDMFPLAGSATWTTSPEYGQTGSNLTSAIPWDRDGTAALVPFGSTSSIPSGISMAPHRYPHIQPRPRTALPGLPDPQTTGSQLAHRRVAGPITLPRARGSEATGRGAARTAASTRTREIPRPLRSALGSGQVQRRGSRGGDDEDYRFVR